MSEALPAFQFYRETRLKEVELNGRKVRISEEWEVVELGEVAEFQRGYSYRRSDLSEVPTLRRFITINELEKEGGLKKDVEPIFLKESVPIDEKFTVKEGDILIANTDMTKGFIIGAPLLVTSELIPETGISIYSMDLTKLLIKKELVYEEFLFYWLSWSPVRSIMKRFSQGLNVQHLNHNLVRTLKVFLPPLPEQKKIAEVLRSIDEAIQAIEESIEKLERLKKGTMEQLLTKGIGHTKFKTVELNGRNVEIPEEWEVVELRKVADINKESVDPRRAFPDKEFVYIDIDSVENGTGKIKTPKRLYGKDAPSRARRVVHANDVIMSTVRPYLKAFALVPEEYDGQVCSTGFAVLTPKPQILDSWYLLYALFSDNTIFQCKSMMVGGQYPALTNAQVAQIKIPLPPLEEQKKIAEILRTIDEAIEAKRQKKEKLERMKKAVMEKLLTGEIRIRHNIF